MTDSFALATATPTSIEITTPPARTRYAYGDTITYQGIAITATYSNGSTADVTSLVSYSATEGSAFNPETDTSVTISFTDVGVTRTCTLSLTEGEPILESIAVTTNPVKMSYRVIDETYDYTGIEVTGSYSDLTTANVTNLCTFEPAQGAHEEFKSDLTATISCTDGGNKQTCSLNFTRILPIWNGISLVSPPTKTCYVAGEVFDFSGLAVKVDYEDGSSLIVTDDWTFISYRTDEYRYRKGGICIYSGYNPIDSNVYDPSKHSELYCVYYEKAEDFWMPNSWNDTTNLSFNVKLKDLDYITVNTQPITSVVKNLK